MGVLRVDGWDKDTQVFYFSVTLGGRRAYPPEFRQQIVELHRAGRSPGELAREFEPNEQTIRNWIAQADLDEGRRRDGLTTVERAELRKLRKENRQLIGDS